MVMDDRYFDQLMRRHGPAVWRLSATLLPDVLDAAEAVDRTFEESRPLLESAHDTVTTRLVLLSACRSICLEHRRRVAAGAGTREAG